MMMVMDGFAGFEAQIIRGQFCWPGMTVEIVVANPAGVFEAQNDHDRCC